MYVKDVHCIYLWQNFYQLILVLHNTINTTASTAIPVVATEIDAVDSDFAVGLCVFVGNEDDVVAAVKPQ